MPTFEDVKQKATETAGIIAGKTVQIAKVVGEKAGTAAKIAKLNAEILGEKETVRKAYVDIGKTYVEKFSDNPDEDLLGGVQKVTEAKLRIRALKDQIAQVKAESKQDDEFTVVDDQPTSAEGGAL
jgi:hypothetical protein